MPEGLSPINVGKEPDDHAATTGGDRHSRMVQIGEALLLSLVTIAAAWSGYAAARVRHRVPPRARPGRHPAQPGHPRRPGGPVDRNFDSSTFTAWFTAYTLDSPQKQAIAIRRFRPEFKVAFDAWMATDPFRNPRAPPGPTYMPQYRLADQAKAEALDREAVATSAAGDHAGQVGDSYIRITVFLAAVLFLVGIGSTFKLHTIRYALIGVGVVLLILATVLILRQPGLPG
jgi:hypothetical protein